MSFNENITKQVKALSEALLNQEKRLVTAESCTGGLLGGAITDQAGSSKIYDRGFIAYSNEAKQQLLGVKAETLQSYGAVSEQTALEMAVGALENSQADISISVTGIAGPDSDGDKPVGLVYIACAVKSSLHDGNTAESFPFSLSGNRQEIREQTLYKALEIARKHLES